MRMILQFNKYEKPIRFSKFLKIEKTLRISTIQKVGYARSLAKIITANYCKNFIGFVGFLPCQVSNWIS